MEYNYKEIGKRIAKERKAAGFKSQDSFLEYLSNEHGYSMGRNTLSAIERGKKGNYDFNFLCTLCKIFKCEIGYLLGEYDCKTGRNTDIAEETGLSETAINKLHNFKYHTLDLSNAEESFRKSGLSKKDIEGIIQDTRNAHEPTIITEYPNILSLFLEHPNVADALSLILRKAKGIRSYQNESDSIHPIGGNLVRINEDEALDFLIQTKITNIIHDIADAYNKKTE